MYLKNSVISLIRTFKYQLLNHYRFLRHSGTNTEEIFSKIYSDNFWGGEKGEFNSGPGTRDEAVAIPYISKLAEFSKTNNFSELVLVDLGCGDMFIGKQLIPLAKQYIGVDIVKELIEDHQKKYQKLTSASFRHLNIIEDDLPDGDVCLIRQVLQHLSNDNISLILNKLSKYKYIFITEHLPREDELIIENKDIKKVGSLRLSEGSGVYITKPPFNIPESSVHDFLELEGYGGIIKTILYQPR